MDVLFVTVSDRRFFPGSLAAVNSVLRHHPEARVVVVSSGLYNEPLTRPQIHMLQNPRVRVRSHDDFARPGRVLGAWQLKAYAAADLLETCDLLVGIDSDAMICGPVNDIIDACLRDGKFRGGRDGDGPTYDESYVPYGFPVPCRNPTYMSTSQYYCAHTEENAAILNDWAAKCDKAVFGPQPEKLYPGHGDQGVLNAVIHGRAPDGRKIELLENRTISQHWRYEQDIIHFREGRFLNASMQNAPMWGFHCVASEKWWTRRHSERMNDAGQGQRWPYAYFLYNLWFGALSDLHGDPYQWLPDGCYHLISDLVPYYDMLMALGGDDVARKWDAIGDQVLERLTTSRGLRRMMSLGTSMSTYIRLAKRAIPEHGGRIAEIGSYLGGSAVTAALSLLHRRATVYSVESFLGNLDGTVDGRRLPSVTKYLASLSMYQTAGVVPVLLDSLSAAKRFPEQFLDMAFIDGNHCEEAVLKDIRAWTPRVRAGGIVAGDDYGWPGVAAAATRFFGGAVRTENNVWWVQI